jgi:hypothetical protein
MFFFVQNRQGGHEHRYRSVQIPANVMKRDTAKKFVQASKKIDEILGELDSVSFEIEDEAERKKIRRAMVSVMVTLYEQLTREVVKDYPDLHPDTGTQSP